MTAYPPIAFDYQESVDSVLEAIDKLILSVQASVKSKDSGVGK